MQNDPRHHFLTKIQLGKNITWNYNELGNGKGTMDGIGRTAENLVIKKVKSNHCIIDSPLQFAQNVNKICESTASLNMITVSIFYLLEQLEGVKDEKPNPDTVQRHKTIRRMNISCFSIDFFPLKFRYRPLLHPMVW